MGNGEFFLGIDEDGNLFSLAARAFEWGPADVALERLIRGTAPRRIHPPGEHTVGAR
jgi:hypothetical protein